LGARSICWVHIFPCSGVMWSICEKIHIKFLYCGCKWKWRVIIAVNSPITVNWSLFTFIHDHSTNMNCPTYSAISRAVFPQTSLNLEQFKAVEGVSAYRRVFLIKKISQQNKTATNEHVFTYKPS